MGLRRDGRVCMNEELPPSRSREGGPTDSSVVGDSCGVGRPALVS
jgi:hypothetical protein